MATSCLSFHAPYRCRHAGACCEAPWDIEVDTSIVEAVSIGRLKAVSVAATPFEPMQDEHGRRFLAPSRTDAGTCGFRHEERCSLHRSGGLEMLPSACRHFPRVYRRDPHENRLTLSHYCPTAVHLLFDSAPVRIQEANPPLALEWGLEGLDATAALPPLLRPAMLADHAGYTAWEDAVVHTFVDAPSLAAAFAQIIASTERIRRWHPSDGPLQEAVRVGFAGAAPAVDGDRLSRGFDVLRAVTGPHPLLEMPRDLMTSWNTARVICPELLDGPLRRYLAACTFGNWVAYRGQGLRSVVEWIRACFDVFRLQVARSLEREGTLAREAIVDAYRQSDYLVVHTVDSLAFGRMVASVE